MIPTTIPLRQFKDHEDIIRAVTVLPDRRLMVTGSCDKTLRLWDLKTGTVLKKMEGHRNDVTRLAVSLGDGQLIASGDQNGGLIAWHGETGEKLIQIITAHSNWISSLDFSPDGTVLATGSADGTTKLWNTTTWQMQGYAIQCIGGSTCVRYSPDGELLAIATAKDIKIHNSGTRECVAKFKGHAQYNYSLAWTPDGTRLLTGGDKYDPTIREWDASTWQQVGDPWMGHSPEYINFIAVHPASNLVASASHDRHLLWRLSDRQTIAIFHPSAWVRCVTFSMDGKHILSGGDDNMISEWAVPRNVLSQETLTEPSSKVLSLSCARLLPHLASKVQGSNSKACFHLSLC
jgi:WD40 repeat protein